MNIYLAQVKIKFRRKSSKYIDRGPQPENVHLDFFKHFVIHCIKSILDIGDNIYRNSCFMENVACRLPEHLLSTRQNVIKKKSSSKYKARGALSRNTHINNLINVCK